MQQKTKKASLLVIALLAILLSFSACGGSNNTPSPTPTPTATPTPTPTPTPEPPAPPTPEPTPQPATGNDVVPTGAGAAFTMYVNSQQALAEVDSLIMFTDILMDMYLDGVFFDEMALSTRIDMVMNSPTSVDMRIEMVTFAEGMEFPTVSYFRDGMLYIDMMDTIGEGLRMSLPMEEVLADLDTEILDFPAQAVIVEEIRSLADGTELTFLLDINHMHDLVNEIVDSMLAELGGLAFQAEFSDILFTAIIDSDGIPHMTLMEFDMYLAIEGEVMLFEFALLTEIAQIGGVVIDFPAHIDAFPYFAG